MAVKKFRVVCEEHAVECASEDAAHKLRESIEKLAACHNFHRVEALVGNEWVGTHIVKAAQICACKVGDKIDCGLDGTLIVAQRGFESATATSDGGGLAIGWCACQSSPNHFRYERWQVGVGRAGHGWGCTGCRRITQTG